MSKLVTLRLFERGKQVPLVMQLTCSKFLLWDNTNCPPKAHGFFPLRVFSSFLSLYTTLSI